MVFFQIKQLVRSIYLKKSNKVYKNSCIIHKNFNNNKFILSRGLYGRYLNVKPHNIGLIFGSFISTRKILNKPFYKKKR